jgi:hypothetical protein
MNLNMNLIYNLPNRKTYYRPVSIMGNYELEESKLYCFHYFNKFGSGTIWKDHTFIVRLKPSDKLVQVLFGLK